MMLLHQLTIDNQLVYRVVVGLQTLQFTYPSKRKRSSKFQSSIDDSKGKIVSDHFNLSRSTFRAHPPRGLSSLTALILAIFPLPAGEGGRGGGGNRLRISLRQTISRIR